MDPRHAFRFFAEQPWLAFLALGSVVLAVTGAEALYAEMGRFGRRPIRYGWFFFVLPALMLNYLGQGALILCRSRPPRPSPFFSLAPSGFELPLVLLSILAATIATQAVVTGAFSVTQQAIQLGFVPRLRIVHTTEHRRNLHSGRQLDPDGGRARPRPHLPKLVGARLGLRSRRHRRDADRHLPARRPDLVAVDLEAVAPGASARSCSSPSTSPSSAPP